MSLSFQEELRDTSLSLDELLRKHQLSLESAFREHKPKDEGRRRRTRPTPYLNIRRENKVYIIRKRIKTKDVYYGRYNSLEEAVLVRDKLREFNWDKSRLDEACSVVGVCRRYYGRENRRPWCKYTLWDTGKVRYNLGHNRVKRRFRVRYNNRDVNIGCFHDPYTCELISDLIKEGVE
jgi:hypothetical protein